MRRHFFSWILFACIGLAAAASPALAQWNELRFVDPSLNWRTLETRNFSVHFAEPQRARAHLAAATAERLLPAIAATLGWTPESRIELVVLDSADFPNGIASPVPFNYSWIFLAPPDDGALLQDREWLELVLTHELFHIVHLDMARTDPLAVRRVFGRLSFLFPNLLQPRWVAEGLAVQAESDAAAGYGRLGQSHFEGMMRAEVARGLRGLSEVNAGGRGFPLNRDYLYGAYFFAFLEERYGPTAVRQYVENYSDNLLPFRVESNPVAVTGKTMGQLWTEYHGWLQARFSPRSGSPLEGEAIAKAFLLASPVLEPDGTRWYVQADGYRRARLMRQAPGGKPLAMRDTEEETRLAARDGGGVLLLQPEICGNYSYYLGLHRMGPDGSARRLNECSRLRQVASLEDGGAVALRLVDGVSEAVVLDALGRAQQTLYRAAPDEALGSVAARTGSVALTSLRGGRWSLIELRDGKASVLLADAAVKHSLRYASDGRLYFIADYGKVYNVWSLSGGVLSRWTAAVNGVREISAPANGSLLLTTIEADGDVLRFYRLPEHPLEQSSAASPAPPAPAEEAPGFETAERAYSPLSSLRPRSWLPLIEIADGAFALGVVTNGQDALALHQYAVAPKYEFTQREFLGDLTYLYDGRHGLALQRAMTVKATDGSEILAYEIGERAHWTSTWRHLALNRRFYWGLGGALERETRYGVATAASPAQDERVLGLIAGVDTRRSQWLSEGPSQGQQLRLFAETSRGLHAAYAGDVYRFDWRVHFALGKTVLSLRWNEARGEADAEPFQLGGSDSDSATTLPVVNQREFALRGYTSGEPALTGNRARLGTLEWRVPLADVDRHIMVPPVGMNRVAMNLFFDAGAAWSPGGEPDYHRGIGAEVMAELRLGYLFLLDLRLGLARGLDERGKTVGYLRAGRAF